MNADTVVAEIRKRSSWSIFLGVLTAALGIVLTGMLVIAGGPRLLTHDQSPASSNATSTAPALTPDDISAIRESRLSDGEPK